MSRQRDYRCPDCGAPFSTASACSDHWNDEHTLQGHEGEMTPETAWMSPNASEYGNADRDGWLD